MYVFDLKIDLAFQLVFSKTKFCEIRPMLRRVARFFWVQQTKMGKIYQNGNKNTKWIGIKYIN
jgi:hypothetical protein